MNRVLAGRKRVDLVMLELCIAGFAAAVPFILMALGRTEAGAVWQVVAEAVLPLLTFALAVLVGMEFPLAGKEDFRGVTGTAAKMYTADYIGACLGALLVSTFLVPVVGVLWVCLLAAGLNCVSALVVWLTGRA